MIDRVKEIRLSHSFTIALKKVSILIMIIKFALFSEIKQLKLI